jgi:uncharacterized protein YkwD
MSATPAPTARTARFVTSRIVSSVAAVAVAASVLLVPQLSSSAAAATSTSKASSTRRAALARYETNMVSLLNKERKAHGVKPVKMNAKLMVSAHLHNTRMAKANTMSHQLPGEKFFADRITHAGYNWQSAGENIGWNTDLSNAGVQSLERQMYNEHAPDNGHRLNILDKSFTQVGINVYYDAKHHKLWFTQDFGQPMS